MHKIPLVLMTFFLIYSIVLARAPISGDRYELLSGAKVDRASKLIEKEKNESDMYELLNVSRFLADNYRFIPKGGNILDLRLSDGDNAVFLARKGYKVSALELSKDKIANAFNLARDVGTTVTVIEKSLLNYKPPVNSFDGIVGIYFINKRMIETILSWLRPGGVLILVSHTERSRYIKHYENVDKQFFLKEGEFLKLFKNYNIIKYEEPGTMDEHLASIIIRKR